MPMCVGDSRDSVQSLQNDIGHGHVKSKCCLFQVGCFLCERYHLGKYFSEILIYHLSLTSYRKLSEYWNIELLSLHSKLLFVVFLAKIIVERSYYTMEQHTS
ncbi:hypothetical protein HOLleu_29286 [Holothuria leucospilota]|uniref:Uncharacterized protein n=1 Tax=Holothuria leucospilota TaxID=206669 RepID=A0A9Q1BNK3_HOLLE|nr:hypothetical protein HOLleu_29286 [Holothuria leucospilota]